MHAPDYGISAVWAATTGTVLVLLHRGGAHPRVTAACTVALLGAFVALVGVDGELADVEHLLAFVLGLATAAIRSPSGKLADRGRMTSPDGLPPRPSVSLARSARDRVPLVLALATAFAGAVNVASALTPELPLRVRQLLAVAHAADLGSPTRWRCPPGWRSWAWPGRSRAGASGRWAWRSCCSWPPVC